MFTIFSKKIYLKDHLEGFIDIHNHILPGIDDGAENVGDSVALIEKFGEFGIRNFIATPHVMNEFYPNTPETINSALEEVKLELKKMDIPGISITAAAEYMMDQSFLELLKREKLLCLRGNFVLVEMSYFQPPINLNEILFQLQTNSYKPVLAHPERYAYFHSKKLEHYTEMKERGCYFQLNLLSVLGHYGKNIQEAAFHLLDSGMIDFIGSDTHQIRHLEKISEAKIPEKKMQQLIPILARTKEIFSS